MVPRGIRSIGKVPEFEQCAKHAKCIRGLFLECPFVESDFGKISLLPHNSKCWPISIVDVAAEKNI